MTGALGWIGARARWVMVIGAFIGLAAPQLAAFLRPALPYLVAVVYTLAMLRIDPMEILRGYMRPRHAARLLFYVFGMLIVSPAVAFWIARLLGLGHDFEAALVYTFAAPPIASAAAMCLIIGFDARRALELTVLCALLMPIVGPAMAGLLLGAALDMSPLALGLRMAAMIFGGFAAALVLRRWLGRRWIAENTHALDGINAIGFLMFITPLFDGVRASIIAMPWLAAAFFALSVLLILGGVALAIRLPGSKARNGGLGAVWGTRAVSIYVAALPPDPAFTLFVALYQLPMAAIPLAFKRRNY